MPKPKVRPRVFGQSEAIEVTSPIVLEPETPADFRDELPLMSDPGSSEVVAEVYTTVSLQIPQSVYDGYVKTAIAQDMSVEELMQHRLVKCKTHNTLRGLWFSDSEHSQLEKLLKKGPITAASQVLTLISQAGVVELDDLKLSLTIPQRKVLNIRTRYGTSPQQIFEAMLRREFQV